MNQVEVGDENQKGTAGQLPLLEEIAALHVSLKGSQSSMDIPRADPSRPSFYIPDPIVCLDPLTENVVEWRVISKADRREWKSEMEVLMLLLNSNFPSDAVSTWAGETNRFLESEARLHRTLDKYQTKNIATVL